MKLADKIMDLRKKMGWSQEQLAERLDISRQSVSKWESGASVPDLDKIIKMSDIFGVSTDYLLKEEVESSDVLGAENAVTEALERENAGQEHEVSLKEATSFMDLVREVSSKIALGAILCVLSPICLLLLGGLSEEKKLLSEDMAGGIGVVVLLLFVAVGAGILILNGMKLDKYGYLEKENIYISEEVRRLVTERKEAYAPVYRKSVVAGVILCICSVIPLFLAAGFEMGDFVYVCCVCILLAVVATGVFCFIYFGTIQGSFDKLLEEGDYTREKKAASKKTSAFAGVYWCIVTALFVGVSFATGAWHITWVIFAVGGILFAACLGIIGMLSKKEAG